MNSELLRSDKDIIEAIEATERLLCSKEVIHSPIALYLPTIREGLIELIIRRKEMGGRKNA
jgi:hypothetical protein